MTDTVIVDRAPIEQRIDTYLKDGEGSGFCLLQEALAEMTQLRFAAKCAIAANSPETSTTTGELIALLRQRDAAGRAKYGTTLDRTDLTAPQWIQHAIEELLDGAGYLKALQRTLATGMPREYADEAMARHWIDRYASGVDDEPQLDRIAEALFGVSGVDPGCDA